MLLTQVPKVLIPQPSPSCSYSLWLPVLLWLPPPSPFVMVHPWELGSPAPCTAGLEQSWILPGIIGLERIRWSRTNVDLCFPRADAGSGLTQPHAGRPLAERGEWELIRGGGLSRTLLGPVRRSECWGRVCAAQGTPSVAWSVQRASRAGSSKCLC